MPDYENYDQDARIFLDKVATELNTPDDLDHAFRVTQSVFQVIRDAIAADDSTALLGQLPADIRGIYEDGWDPGQEKAGFATSEDFYNALRDHSGTVPLDFFDNTESRQAVQAVFKVLREPATASVLKRLREQLPESLRDNL
jgi:uncharacterized protein (DUF2267 family)